MDVIILVFGLPNRNTSGKTRVNLSCKLEVEEFGEQFKIAYGFCIHQ